MLAQRITAISKSREQHWMHVKQIGCNAPVPKASLRQTLDEGRLAALKTWPGLTSALSRFLALMTLSAGFPFARTDTPAHACPLIHAFKGQSQEGCHDRGEGVGTGRIAEGRVRRQALRA